MAELTPEMLNKLVEAITDAADRIGSSSKKMSDELYKSATVAKEERAQRSAASGVYKKTIEDLERQRREKQISHDEYIQEMKNLKEETRFLGKEHDDLKKQINASTTGFKGFHGVTDNFINKTMPAVGSSMLKVAGLGMEVAKAFQGGGAGFQAASSVITAGIGVTGGAFASAGAAAQALGSNIAVTNKRTGALNLGLQGLGLALSAVGKSAPLFNAAVDIMVRQVGVISEGYSKAGSAGALFADSFGGFAKSAAGAGLTIEQFGRFLTNNNQVLFTTGLGIAEAAKRVGSVGEAAKKSGLTDSLLKLGYGLEEQAELTARVMADMQRAGTLDAASDTDIAQATEKYATNLRVIAAITGEDAKKRQEAAREQMNNLAVQAKIAEMRARGDNAGAARMEAILATAPKGTEKLVTELLATGGNILTRESGILVGALGKAGGAFVDNIMSLANNTAMSRDDVTKAMGGVSSSLREGIESNIENFRTLGLAALQGNNNLGQVSEVIGGLFASIRGNTADTAKNAAENAEKAKKSTDDITDSFIKGSKSVQEFALELDKATLKAAAPFANALATIINGLKDTLAALTGGSNIIERLAQGAGLFLAAGATLGSLLVAYKGMSGSGPGGGLGGGSSGGGGTAGPKPTTGSGVPVSKGSSAAGAVAKGVGKGAAKLLPGVGMVMGIIDAGSRISQGDYAGAALAGGSGLAAMVPGFGTAASAALSATGMARDAGIGFGNTTGVTPTAPPASLNDLSEFSSELERIREQTSVPVTQAPESMMRTAPRVSIEDLAEGISRMNLNMQNLLKATQDVVSNTAKTARGVS